MNVPGSTAAAESDRREPAPTGRPILAGIEVREDDIESPRGINIVSAVVRASAVLILLLALGQFAHWWLNRPPGGAGIGLLVGDTIRLIVFAALLWAAGELATLVVKTHHDIRASRILAARQTYMLRQMGMASGYLAPPDPANRNRPDGQA
jgi:hypothetical protein